MEHCNFVQMIPVDWDQHLTSDCVEALDLINSLFVLMYKRWTSAYSRSDEITMDSKLVGS